MGRHIKSKCKCCGGSGVMLSDNPAFYEAIAADVFLVSTSEIRSRSRKASVTDARQAFWLAMREGGAGLEAIGNLSGRNHTAVLRGIESIKNKMETEPKLRERVEALREMVKL